MNEETQNTPKRTRRQRRAPLPITSSTENTATVVEMPTPAPRPLYSREQMGKLRNWNTDKMLKGAIIRIVEVGQSCEGQIDVSYDVRIITAPRNMRAVGSVITIAEDQFDPILV